MAQSGGGFTYAVNLVPLLATRMPEIEILAVLRSPGIAEALPALPNLSVELLPEAGLVERIRFLGYTAPALARRWGADLYYSASELSPLWCPCPKIAAFRNANLFTRMPLGWPLRQRLRMRTLAAFAWHSARTCDRILFVSDDSARWIGDHMRLPPGKRVTVPHGIDLARWSRGNAPSPVPRPFVLSVSSIYRYKNFVRLIEAWTHVARDWPDAPDLVIVGDDQDPLHSSQMRAARERAGELAARIHLVGGVPYSEITRYYANAQAFVFPSYLETFGHPLLEAMAAGLPVMASDMGVFREVGDDAAVYFDPHDVDSIASVLDSVLRDADRQAMLVRRGQERVSAYTWDRTVDGLIGVFEEVLGGHRV
jgi:glycosyltransferase involved in cell wall biosynthesis